MRPVLFAFHAPLFGEVSFPAYFTLLTIGFGLAMILTVRESRRLGMDHERILDTNLWMVVWGIIGARVLHLIADGHFHDYVNLCRDPEKVPAIDALTSYCTTAAQCGYDYLCNAATHKCYPPRDCFAAVKVWRGGLAYYGGFVFAVAFAYYYVRKYKLGWWRTADLSAPGIMLGLVCGRLGCFLNGCCYGKPTTSWLGVVFPQRPGTAVHPTQLYESVAGGLLLVLALVVWRKRRFPGQVLLTVGFGYAVFRFLIELWRDDAERGRVGPELARPVAVACGLLALGAALAVGPARSIRGRVGRALAWAAGPAVALGAYALLRPAPFVAPVLEPLSTSQWAALFTGTAAALAYRPLERLHLRAAELQAS